MSCREILLLRVEGSLPTVTREEDVSLSILTFLSNVHSNTNIIVDYQAQ